jgi:mycofactocin system creatininase family protein
MSRLLAEMTSPEVDQAIAAGITTVILPLGATEQHGPHLPLGTDTFRAAALADGLGAASTGTLVAPLLPVGCSDEHTGFAGLLGLDHETLARVIVDCGNRMAAWGVRRLVLLSAHGGNGRALKLARARLQEEASELEVWVLESSATLTEALLRIAAADGISAEALGLHAGERETSEMLHLRAELVHMDRAVAGYAGSMAEVMPRLRQRGVREVTPTGTLGDPRAASARRGAVYLATQIDSFCRMLVPERARDEWPARAGTTGR